LTVSHELSLGLEPWLSSGRIVAMAGQPGAGPDVLIVGGLHGNEPEGMSAGRRVLSDLNEQEVDLPGRVALVAGNKAALQQGKRFLDRDLNRRWRSDAIVAVRERSVHERSREDREQLDLVACFEAFMADAQHGVVVIDLHTTSAGAPPFAVVIDSLENRTLASSIGLPVILGFDDYVDAPILCWFDDMGCLGVGIEGGSGGVSDTEAHLADATWDLLSRLGWPSGVRSAVSVEREADAFRIAHRHSVVPGSGFRMEPGFRSFQQVEQGQLLAHDRGGAIRAMLSGQIFMPLYQPQGSDGFFLLSRLD
jgi:predicted deacylase